MGILETCRDRFVALCESKGIPMDAPVRVGPLTPDEAIGEKASRDFPIRKGKETVIEAVFSGARGQAFTDHPSRFEDSLCDVFSLDLRSVQNRALFTATMNAVLRFMSIATRTVHCRNEAPHQCGKEVVRHILTQHGRVRVGLVGLQPAILGALVEHLGSASVGVVDRNPENIGKEKAGVVIRDGATHLSGLVTFSDVGLITGSSIVNDTLDDIASAFAGEGKPVIYYGNTISGAAALCELARLCPFGQ